MNCAEDWIKNSSSDGSKAKGVDPYSVCQALTKSRMLSGWNNEPASVGGSQSGAPWKQCQEVLDGVGAYLTVQAPHKPADYQPSNVSVNQQREQRVIKEALSVSSYWRKREAGAMPPQGSRASSQTSQDVSGSNSNLENLFLSALAKHKCIPPGMESVTQGCMGMWFGNSANASAAAAERKAAAGNNAAFTKAIEQAVAQSCQASGGAPAPFLFTSTGNTPRCPDKLTQFLDSLGKATAHKTQSSKTPSQGGGNGAGLGGKSRAPSGSANTTPDSGSSAAAVAKSSQTYLDVPSQDAQDMYLEGAEKETVQWPETEGGGERKLAIKVISSVLGAAENNMAAGTVMQNYIAVVDYTDPQDIFQKTFLAASGSHDFYLDDRDPEHMKYHFKLDVGQDGGIVLSRVDTKPSVKKKGFLGKIENFVGGLLHGKTATPVVYTSVAQLYVDRDDEIQNRPAAQISLNVENYAQNFNVISQGGPRGCLLFFAMANDGRTILEGPDGEAPGYKPNLMACVNHAEGGGMTAMESGPQCLGTFARGSESQSYSIQWMPQSASAGNDFQIVQLSKSNDPPCNVPPPKKPSGSTTPGGKPAPGTPGNKPAPPDSNGKCPSGTELQGDKCVPLNSAQNECNYNLNGKDASGNDKMEVGDMDDGYALYVGPQTLPLKNGYTIKAYQSYICNGGSLVQIPGIVYGFQSGGDEMSVSAYGAQYSGGVSPQDFADMTVSASKNDKANKHFSENFINLKSGQSLEFSPYMHADQIYNFPAGDFGPSAPQKALLSQNAANSIETIDPVRKDVIELDVYPRGGDVAAAVKRAIDNHLQKADPEKVGALQRDEDGVLEKQLSKLPADAVVEIHLQGGQTASGATGCSPAVGASYSSGGKQVDKTIVDYKFSSVSGGQNVTLSPFMARCEPTQSQQ